MNFFNSILRWLGGPRGVRSEGFRELQFIFFPGRGIGEVSSVLLIAYSNVQALI